MKTTQIFRFALGAAITLALTACDDNNSNEPEFIIDDPQDAVQPENLWDYYHADGAIRRIEWVDDNYFISSTKAEYITDEYLAQHGVEVEKRHREGTNEPNSLEVETDANWAFIRIKPNEAVKNVADLRKALDNKSVYCAPVYYEKQSYGDFDKRIKVPSRLFSVTCIDDVRTDFIALFESLGGRMRARNKSYFKIMTPTDMTSIEFSNVLWQSDMVVSTEIILDGYLYLSPVAPPW